MRAIVFLACAGLGLALGGCATAKDAIRGPRLSPMDPAAVSAASLSANQSPAILASLRAPAPAPFPAQSANSLWRPGARGFFPSNRASQVGDILTVLIEIDDSAKLSNNTDSSRTNATKGGVAHFFGLEHTLGKILPSAFDPANAIDQSGNTSSAGAASLDRQEKISLTVAAVVTGVLPNGNLIIKGSQEVRANNELRELTVSGIVRPADIGAANTINHTQIAEARISYGGRGDMSRVQKTPAGQALMESFSPF